MTARWISVAGILFLAACTTDDQSTTQQETTPRVNHGVTEARPAGQETTPPRAEPRFARESSVLADHVQLTFSSEFLKAGESYFSPDDSKVIFQAIPTPADGQEPELYYQMYVGDVVRDGRGRITGLSNYVRLTPPGSSSTCGWFHPTEPNTVIFGSTIVPPATPDVAGYQRGSSRYKWQFPKEMTIVKVRLDEADGTAASMETILADDDGYLAECSFTTDGRHLLFCRYLESEAPAGGDLYALDLETGREFPLVDFEGYDGGPFFSPCERFICYRSDRRGNNELQIFVAELEYDDQGTIVGIRRETAVTDNAHVNWAPFWHPSGSSLVYATSEVGHFNYEVYRIDTMLDALARGESPDHEATKLRVTNAEGFDGLPVFNSDGSLMMWTGQRDGASRETRTSQLWVARYLAGPSSSSAR